MSKGWLLGLLFEWDEKKASINKRKHGITFEEATTAFGDTQSITVHDPLHSDDEERFVLIGMSEQLRVLVVVHVERREYIRIISARRATKSEQHYYEEV